MTLEHYLASRARQVNQALDHYLPKATRYPSVIHRAMRYSVLNGGKRIRPILAIAVTEACAGHVKDVLPAACSLELIHAFSLVHDDLPAMDNDDFRRGKPTCHKRFGEAFAILAGDALLNLSFQILAQHCQPRVAARLIPEIAAATGTAGMIGGQVADTLAQGKSISVRQLKKISRYKTAQLIKVSCVTGAIVAHTSLQLERRIRTFGEQLGLAFQLVDDLLDGDGLAQATKRERVFAEAQRLTTQAKTAVSSFNGRANRLTEICDFILHRRK